MKILVDENMPLARELFASFGEVLARPGRSLTADDVHDADVLLVRSVTRVDEALLAGSRVRFVGTATIGTDHVDLDWLRAQGIAFASAPGCNAMSVVDYVSSALLELADRHDFALAGRRAGIVGLGNVGSRLQRRLQALGLEVLACDPPLADAGHTGLVDMDAIAGCDIVSFHTPLLRHGAHPSFHLADAALLARLKPGAILLNTSRGAVVDNAALLSALERRDDLHVVLDVWEGEPLVDRRLAARVELATPHIAGYSYDGKLRGTWMLYEALCAFLDQPPTMTLASLVPDSARRVLDLAQLAPRRALDLVYATYRITDDDTAFRATLDQTDDIRAAAFDRLRKQYPLRREFATVEIVHGGLPATRLPVGEAAMLRALGFPVAG
ncbi:4-phosphoerythronate dehydrogenase [Dyella thiooxydans]|uniref:Erythronate-4-phosphate dehydrogenase n=1 Tax=Dyella thiooxydans TaxID=445710 RepID=A0A160N2V0_9GAMM|nr:4-phosphoerythronate dehydrogenase PdxB [Dyella thiooxydans]AND70251.1 4-phosphoerythronate dehydrogenase [Dyella thiooxydans]